MPGLRFDASGCAVFTTARGPMGEMRIQFDLVDEETACWVADYLNGQMATAVRAAVAEERAACLAIASRRKREGAKCDPSCVCALCQMLPIDIETEIRKRGAK